MPVTTRSQTSSTLTKKSGKMTRTRRQAMPPLRGTGGPRRKFPKVSKPKSKGLQNRSAVTCYRNATLQALFHTPAFYRYMSSFHDDCDLPEGECVPCALQSLVLAYWADDDPVERFAELDTFNNACEANLPSDQQLRVDFAESKQSDCYEFLRYLLEEQVKPKDQPENQSKFKEVFGLELEERRFCNDCGNETIESVDHAFLGLHLPMEDLGQMDNLGHLVQNCLHVDGKEVTCVRCLGKYQDCYQSITHAPQILVIRLGIFALNDFGEQHKITDDVDYPELLDLNQRSTTQDDCVYRLDGVVAHYGDTIDFGHYIALVRDHNSPGEFTQISDEDVETGKVWQDVSLPVINEDERAHSYMLVYSRY